MNVWTMLKIPFSQDKVRWRVARITKNGSAQVLAYVDARDVMDRLDDVLGPNNWQDQYSFHGDRILCNLSIREPGTQEWITKVDGAGDTAVESEKGGLSDAFKRAAVKFGINRDMYNFGNTFAEVDQWKKIKGTPKVPQWYIEKRQKMIEEFKSSK